MTIRTPLNVSAPISFGSISARPPLAFAGMRIGLLGGSFNPAHAGHRNISLAALKSLQLDQVWWLVSPGNPLKNPNEQSPITQRVNHAINVSAHPRIIVTDVETRLKSSFTIGTLTFLQRRYPGVNFVWLMGADNLATFHAWEHWEKIAQLMPIAVFDRPGHRLPAISSKTAQRFAFQRDTPGQNATFAMRSAPAWKLIALPLSPESSTQIRKRLK